MVLAATTKTVEKVMGMLESKRTSAILAEPMTLLRAAQDLSGVVLIGPHQSGSTTLLTCLLADAECPIILRTFDISPELSTPIPQYPISPHQSLDLRLNKPSRNIWVLGSRMS